MAHYILSPCGPTETGIGGFQADSFANEFFFIYCVAFIFLKAYIICHRLKICIPQIHVNIQSPMCWYLEVGPFGGD